MPNDISAKIKKLCTMSKYSAGPKQAIEDMVQLAFNLVTQRAFLTLSFPRTRVHVNEDLRNEVRRYEKDPAAWALMQEIVVDYMKAISEAEPFADVIGGMYDEYLGTVLGQFLTPSDVAQAVAEISMVDMMKPTEKMRIGDPCGCGAGSLILGQLRVVLSKFGPEGIKLMDVFAMDLDPKMVQLCTVQIMMSSIIHRIPLASLEIFWGNAITDYKNLHEKVAVAWYPAIDPREYFETSHEVRAMNKLMERFVMGEIPEEILN